MKRLIGNTAIVIATSMLVLVSPFAPTARANELGREEVGDRRAGELIDDLGSEAVKVVYPQNDYPYLIIPDAFNWETHEKVKTTIGDLVKMGVTAFPDLAAHVNDDRFCCFTAGPVDRPANVGWICNEIMKCQLDVYNYSANLQGELVSRYKLERQVLSRSKAQNWIEWWQKNKDKSLLEMQIAVAESSLSILKSEKEGSHLNTWGSPQVQGIEQLIRELKADKKPKPGKLSLNIRLIRRSNVTKSGDEERYRFYNGK